MSVAQVSSLLSELPTSWTWQCLRDVLKVRNGFAFKSSDYQKSGVLLIRQSNLGGNRVSLEKAEYLPERFLKDHADFCVGKGDVLIGMSGSIGKLCVYDRDEPALQNQRTGLLKFKDPSLKNWIWHYLPLIETKLHEGGKGVGVQNISASQIEELPIPIAPEEERVQIVAEIEKQFSRLDEAVASLKRTKANLKRYKAAVLKAAVEGKLTEDWRKQHPDIEPASKLLDRILAERRAKWSGSGKYKEPLSSEPIEAPSIPKGWMWATLDQVSDSIQDGNYGEQHPKESDYFKTGIPFLSAAVIAEDGRLDRQAFKYISHEQHKSLTKAQAKTGDIIFPNRGARTGQLQGLQTFAVMIPESIPEANVNPQLTRIKVAHPVRSRYFRLALCSPVFLAQFRRAGSGSALGFVGLLKSKQLQVPIPPLLEQDEVISEVERRLSVIDELEASVEANLTRADRLRQSILSQAFTGKLTCVNANREGRQSADIEKAKA